MSRKALAAIREVWHTMAAVMSGIFDESAYQRYLERGELQPSRATYASFCRERDQARARRARCC